MHKIESGPATSTLAVANDGIGHARVVGLYLSHNSMALSVKVLQAATGIGAAGLIVALDRVALAMAPMTSDRYVYVPPSMRGIPVALIANGEQAAVLGGVQSAAAQAGMLRRVFSSEEQGIAWVQEQARALAANRVWGWHRCD